MNDYNELEAVIDYRIKQMTSIDDRIVFLTMDGQVGSFDHHFESVNMNYALHDIAFLLASDWVDRDTELHFQRPIEFDEKLGQLTWGVEQAGQQPKWGEVLYQVELYQFNFSSGTKTVVLSNSPSYDLPQSLLDRWGSRQKFDVRLDALNPWTVETTNKTGLNAPTKPPGPPFNLRIYATQQKTVDGTRAIIDLFWDEPKELVIIIELKGNLIVY
jgi:hypothetical protein